jgi:uncharacterized Tic20 family protein
MPIPYLDKQEKQYAALTPILTIAGIFAHPMASVILPLVMFFIFYWRRKTNASLVAIRCADLAFSIQLTIIITSLLVMLAMSVFSITQQEARIVMTSVTVVLLLYMTLSLALATFMVFRDKIFRHWFSFRIGERLLKTLRQGKTLEESH